MDYSLDIWALGCILFELSRGEKAFQDDWSTHGYYQTNDCVRKTGRVVFSDIDEAIIAREISNMTLKEPAARPPAQVVLERVQEILKRPFVKDAATQTEPVVIHRPDRERHPVQDDTEIWIVRDTVISPTNYHVVTGSLDRDRSRYNVQLWSVDNDEILWETVQEATMICVIPTFSQNGRYLVVYSRDSLEIIDTEELRVVWSFKPRYAVLATCVRDRGDGVAYSYKNLFVTSRDPQLILEEAESHHVSSGCSRNVDVIQSALMSDVSLTYDRDARYLYAVAKPDMDVCYQNIRGYVWILDRKTCIKRLTFSSGEYREFPIRGFAVSKPGLAVLSSNPTPKADVRTILRLYTQKGTITHQFGSGGLILTPSLKAMFILSVGKLLYHDRDLPEFEYGDYGDEPVRTCRWLYVSCPAELSNDIEDYSASTSRLPLCLWWWNGKDKEPQWIGKLTMDILDFEDVKAFVLQGEEVKLWLDDGTCVNSSVVSGITHRVLVRKRETNA